VEIDKAAPYAAEDADVTLRLWHLFKPQLHRAKVTTVYETLERPLVPVLARMERRHQGGPRYAQPHVQRLRAEDGGAGGGDPRAGGRDVQRRLPKQLGEILFEKMGLEGGKKGKTGPSIRRPPTCWRTWRRRPRPAGRVLDWRQLSKLKSTYTDALQDHINPETGRVHTSYSIAGANTGRLASTDPNLQNIPVRTEEGPAHPRGLRRRTGQGAGLARLFSQIELRILAHIAGIDALKQAFKDGQDIHA
jgi:DNA polymerase-1